MSRAAYLSQFYADATTTDGTILMTRRVRIWKRFRSPLDWSVAERADEVALPFVLAWTLCLFANVDLLETLSPLTAMGSRLPQIVWAFFGLACSTVEIAALIRRRLGLAHRLLRMRALVGDGVFFAWLAGELAVRDLGLPAVYYFAWLALISLLGAGRLLRGHLVETEIAEAIEASRGS